MTPRDDRPAELAGATQRIETGWGKVYVTVNDGPGGEPFEVFVATGQSGGLYNSQAEAIGKLASTALRSGADAEEVADALTGIRTDRVAEDHGDEVKSIPDAVGIALQRHATGGYEEPVRGDAGPGNGGPDEGPEVEL